MPFGNYHDDDRPEFEDEIYDNQRVRIGDLREATKDIKDIFDEYYPVK